MKIYSNKDMEEGLDYYDPEKRAFTKFAKANGGQKLSKRDVLLILKWKLGRIKDDNAKTVADDKLRAINEAIQDASKSGCEIAAIEALEKIPGIGLATATAILTVCYPEKFTIIDRRVLETLNLFPSSLDKSKPKEHKPDKWTAADYMNEFLPKVLEYSKQWGCSLRSADQALWGLSVRERVKEIIANV